MAQPHGVRLCSVAVVEGEGQDVAGGGGGGAVALLLRVMTHAKSKNRTGMLQRFRTNLHLRARHANMMM